MQEIIHILCLTSKIILLFNLILVLNTHRPCILQKGYHFRWLIEYALPNNRHKNYDYRYWKIIQYLHSSKFHKFHIYFFLFVLHSSIWLNILSFEDYLRHYCSTIIWGTIYSNWMSWVGAVTILDLKIQLHRLSLVLVVVHHTIVKWGEYHISIFGNAILRWCIKVRMFHSLSNHLDSRHSCCNHHNSYFNLLQSWVHHPPFSINYQFVEFIRCIN